MNGGVLDIVLVQKCVNVSETHVQATDGIVNIDRYHPPLDVSVKIHVARQSDCIEPSNIDPKTDWNFRSGNYIMLSHMLSVTSWDTLYSYDDIELATSHFYNTLYDLFDTCIPKKRRNGLKAFRYPVWFTRDIINDIKQKRRLHNEWKHTGTQEAYTLFSDLRSELKSRISLAYDAHLTGIQSNLKCDPRQFWRHISSLKSKGGFESNVVYNGKNCSGVVASEAFADFFSSVFLSDLPTLDANAITTENHLTANSILLPKITADDVVSGIRSLKSESSIGPDGIPPWFLKEGQECLIDPICHLFNIALSTGKYPTQWKLSRVTPIPKSSGRERVEEYRPIAILSTLAKVFERILHTKIYRQVEPFLSDEQHGFRKKRSVNTNLLIITDFISSCLDRRAQVDVLYFDFRKAFDRVNNDILLEKLSALGFAPGLLCFIADYLRNRQQYVRLGFYESQPYHTRSGVSQGSILGPLFFNLMLNDLPSVVKHAKCLLYADDLKLYMEVNSFEDCLLLQRDIDSVYQWSVSNKMEFNTSKCSLMTYGRKRHPVEFLYKLNCQPISRSTTMKDLGVVFDQKLSFNDHVAVLAKESFRRLGFVLRNARDFDKIDVLKLLFSTLVRSKLEASACVWNPHEASRELLLEKVQKRYLRFLYKRAYGYYPYMYPTNFLLGALGYNSLQVRRLYDQLLTMCKILRGDIDAPELNRELCRFYVPGNYLSLRKHRLFAVPLCRTVSRSKSPIPRVLTAFNTLLCESPRCDLFNDVWKVILSECLKFCEKDGYVVSSIVS